MKCGQPSVSQSVKTKRTIRSRKCPAEQDKISWLESLQLSDSSAFRLISLHPARSLFLVQFWFLILWRRRKHPFHLWWPHILLCSMGELLMTCLFVVSPNAWHTAYLRRLPSIMPCRSRLKQSTEVQPFFFAPVLNHALALPNFPINRAVPLPLNNDVPYSLPLLLLNHCETPSFAL